MDPVLAPTKETPIIFPTPFLMILHLMLHYSRFDVPFHDISLHNLNILR